MISFFSLMEKYQMHSPNAFQTPKWSIKSQKPAITQRISSSRSIHARRLISYNARPRSVVNSKNIVYSVHEDEFRDYSVTLLFIKQELFRSDGPGRRALDVSRSPILASVSRFLRRIPQGPSTAVPSSHSPTIVGCEQSIRLYGAEESYLRRT